MRDLWLGVVCLLVVAAAIWGFPETNDFVQGQAQKLISIPEVETSYVLFLVVLGVGFVVAPSVRAYSGMKKDPDSPYMVLLNRIYAIAKLSGVRVRARGITNVFLVSVFNSLHALAYARYLIVNFRFLAFQDKKKRLPTRPPIFDERVASQAAETPNTATSTAAVIEDTLFVRILTKPASWSLIAAPVLVVLILRDMFLDAGQSRGLFQLALGFATGRSLYHLALAAILVYLLSLYLLYHWFPGLVSKKTVRESARETPPITAEKKWQPPHHRQRDRGRQSTPRGAASRRRRKRRRRR